MLSTQEIQRYSRHLLLAELGMKGQEKLKAAKVLVIGAGGLGCPALMYLAAAGVGEIGVLDFDVVEESNLQRQVLYSSKDVGQPKATCAAKKIQEQNPWIKCHIYDVQITNQNALEIIDYYDVVIDGTDNFSTRYLVNDACVIRQKPLVYGSIYRFEGQVSVFNDVNAKTKISYRTLFPEPPSVGASPNCSEIGVLGVLPGMIGSMMANETIKMITGIGTNLHGRLLIFNALHMRFTTLDISFTQVEQRKIPNTPEAFKAFDYAFFCGERIFNDISTITVQELKKLLNQEHASPIELLDVREYGEQPEISSLGALQIPLGLIAEQAHRISKTKKVVVFCKGGSRSKKAIDELQKLGGFDHLYNLEGGIMEWIQHNKQK